MDELKAYDCPQCGGHYTPSLDNKPTECDYCGTFLEVIRAEPDLGDSVKNAEILGEYLNTVLPKITEMTSYFPELAGDSFEGQFFKQGLEDYLKKCDDKYNAIANHAQVRRLAEARRVLRDNGIPVPDLSPTST